MKKIVCIILAVLMVISLVACNGPASGTEGTKNPQKETQAPKPTETEPVGTDGKTTEPEKTEKKLKIIGDLYISHPAEYKSADLARTKMVIQSSACVVSIAYDKTSALEGDLEDAIALLSQAFANDSSSYCEGSISGNEIETTSTERGTVAGFDCVRFSGKIKNGGGWDCHVYGYTMIVEDRVLMITGLVSTQAQDAGMIAEIDALTDRIAASVYVKG